MWRFMAGVVVGAVIVAAGGLVLVARDGLSARTAPSALEARAARAIRRLAIPAERRDRANPLPASARVLAEGRAHFADHCASCHGNDGRGQSELGRSLYPRAPDLRAAATQSLTDGELFHAIEEGVRFTGMPAWGGAGKPEESWKLVHFVRHLPQLTEEERAEMERLNPRPLEAWRELEEEDAFLRGEAAPGGHAH